MGDDDVRLVRLERTIRRDHRSTRHGRIRRSTTCVHHHRLGATQRHIRHADVQRKALEIRTRRVKAAPVRPRRDGNRDAARGRHHFAVGTASGIGRVHRIRDPCEMDAVTRGRRTVAHTPRQRVIAMAAVRGPRRQRQAQHLAVFLRVADLDLALVLARERYASRRRQSR